MPRGGAVARPSGPAIAVPTVRRRGDGVDFEAAQAAALGPGGFTMPSARVRDDCVPNGPRPAGIKSRVRYVATPQDLDWLAAKRESLKKAQAAALTLANVEGAFTALELSSTACPQLPVDRVTTSADLLRHSGVDISAMPLDSEPFQHVKQYWASKRAALNRPLIPDLLIWPHEGMHTKDLPFLSRENDIDVWLRRAPTVEAPKSAQAEEAARISREFVNDAVALADALVDREEKRAREAYAVVHELAAARFVACLPDVTSGVEMLYATDDDLDAPLDATAAAAVLAFGNAPVSFARDTLAEDDAAAKHEPNAPTNGHGVKAVAARVKTER